MSDNCTTKQQQIDEQGSKTINKQLLHEIAERKRLEEALNVSNNEFRDFIHMVSHDLREPLRKISSFGMLLKDSLDGKLDKENQENLGFMIDGAERMTQMIEDLLAYSRINTKAISLDIVDLNKLIEQLEQLELATLLEEASAIIEIPKPLPKINADPDLIRQLLLNLIINGIKNCRDNRDDIQPRILIRAENVAGNKVRIELQDNGSGIQKQHHKDIFRMVIHSNPKQEKEGVGTGLAVCKKIVDKHGGQIGVESKVDIGSTFWFILPELKTVEQEQDNPVSCLRT